MNKTASSCSSFSRRNILVSLATVTGMMYVLRVLRRHKSFILAYHRVLPDDSPEIAHIQPGMYVSEDTFAMHMDFLSRNYRVMPLAEMVLRPGVANACAVTFDDGWGDNYRYAYPVLKRYGIQATIFIVTDWVGASTLPWPDLLYRYYVGANEAQRLELCAAIDHDYSHGTQARGRRRGDDRLVVEGLIEKAKRMGADRRAEMMAIIDVQRAGGSERVWLSWEEMQEMQAGGIVFGAHGHRHKILTHLSDRQIREEIVLSRQCLEQNLGVVADQFCYPNGDWDFRIAKILEQEKFKMALTTDRGFLDDSPGLYSLRRVLIHEDVSHAEPLFVWRLMVS